MKNEVIKQAFKLGNSAGVLLPISWKGKKVAIKLIEKSIPEEVLGILEEEDLLKNTIGIFLAGSYARNEETELSDIDILIITDNINKQVKIGKYELVFISQERMNKLVRTSLFLASLVNEAKTILNNTLLNYYKNEIKKINTKDSLDDIKLMTKTNEKLLKIFEEDNQKVIDGTVYSLVLRLRELYLIECFKRNKNPSIKDFINLISEVSSKESYNAYLRVKNDLKTKQIISTEEAVALLDETKKRIAILEHGKKN
nr:hypothetical protein [uncultured archaeon]